MQISLSSDLKGTYTKAATDKIHLQFILEKFLSPRIPTGKGLGTSEKYFQYSKLSVTDLWKKGSGFQGPHVPSSGRKNTKYYLTIKVFLSNKTLKDASSIMSPHCFN